MKEGILITAIFGGFGIFLSWVIERALYRRRSVRLRSPNRS